MDTFYTVQFNQKTKKLIVFKENLQPIQQQLNSKQGYDIISIGFRKKKQAEAVKEFIEKYILDQLDSVVNWKPTSDNLNWICTYLEEFIEEYNEL